MPWERLTTESTAILRQVVEPIYLGGFSTAEIATELQIPPSSVRLLVSFFATEVAELGQPDDAAA